ncbi:hypothetical protein LEMLEM_LOCUS6390, partial [Lemmus lemmus]
IGTEEARALFSSRKTRCSLRRVCRARFSSCSSRYSSRSACMAWFISLSSCRGWVFSPRLGATLPSSSSSDD